MNHLLEVASLWFWDFRTWMFWGLSGLDWLAGSWRAWRRRQPYSSLKAQEGIDRLVQGSIALLACSMAQYAQLPAPGWLAFFAALGIMGGVSVVQIRIIAPAFVSVLQNCGVLPKPQEDPPR